MSDSVATDRIFNFSAGPAVLPLAVLQEVQRDLLALPGAGASVLEISHRSKQFGEILEQAQRRIGELLNVPENYKIMFLQGGSRLQFSMVPMNLLRDQSGPAEYLVTGSWGKKALEQAHLEGTAKTTWDGKPTNYNRLPESSEIEIDPQAAYVYYTSNETIQGVQFGTEPEVGDIPLVCDASSDFMSRPLPMDRYGLLYACAQKNAGPAGVTVVIIRDDLLERSQKTLPGYLNYREHVDNNSMYNTPPTFGVYVMGLVAKWLQEEVGGLQAMHERNQAKAAQLYAAIEASGGFYTGHAEPSARSLMNVTFRLPSDELTEAFVAAAAAENLGSLKGHRSVGGIRASIYNAMPEAGVETLVRFMQDFCAKHG